MCVCVCLSMCAVFACALACVCVLEHDRSYVRACVRLSVLGLIKSKTLIYGTAADDSLALTFSFDLFQGAF